MIIANSLLINIVILDEQDGTKFQKIHVTPTFDVAKATITIHRNKDHYNGLAQLTSKLGLCVSPRINDKSSVTTRDELSKVTSQGFSVIHRQQTRPVVTHSSSGIITYTSDELRNLRPNDAKIPREIRKKLFSSNIWKPKNTARPFDTNTGVHPHLIREIPKKDPGTLNHKNLLLNTRSIRNKASTVREHIIDTDASIAMFTETWLKSGEDDILKELTPDGFKNIIKNRQNSRGGGVAIIYRDTLEVRETITATYSTFEHLSVTIRSNISPAQCHLTLVYRPPSSSIPTFLDEIGSHLDSLSEYAGEVMVAGDINLHLDVPNSQTTLFLDLLNEHNLQQLVSTPTHKDGHILDIVACSSPLENLQVIKSAISDHFSITWEYDKLNSNIHRNNAIQYKCRLLKNFSEVSFNSDLESKLKTVKTDSSVNTLCSEYLSVVSGTYNAHAPLVTKSSHRSKVSPWMTSEIREARLLRRSNEAVWRRSKLEVHRQIYCQHRDDVVRMIREAKQNHYEEQLSTRDPKATFKVINELTKNNEISLPAPPSTQLCNQFINFFTDKITIIQSGIAKVLSEEKLPTNITPDIDTAVKSIMDKIRPVTPEELTKLIRSSNSKTSALDPCPTDVLKGTFETHKHLILQIFNKSFQEGIFPDAFKTAQLSPIIKSPSMDKHLFKNYRPVSNLPTLGKLLERIGVQRLNEHLLSSEKVEVHQSAYKPGHSTETALLKVFNDIALQLDRSNVMLLAMIDLSAAFDTICHTKLARLLEEEYGITGSALSWYKSYFSNRTHFCKIGSFRSANHELTIGCPQGSVMGPIAYNLYTAPLERILKRHGVKYHKYADDLQVYHNCEIDQIGQAKVVLESCIADVRSWMLRWGLKINDSKTEFIIFSNPSTRIPSTEPLQIANCGITASPHVKNLGSILDSNLSRSPHVSQVVKSCNFHLRQLGRIRRYLTAEACKRAVHALIISRLDYCNSLLADIPVLLLEKLQHIQNRAARLILCVSRRECINATPLLKKLSWLPVELRIIFKMCVLVFKCLNGSAPTYLEELVHLYRRDERLRQPPANTLQSHPSKRKIGKSSFLVAAPSYWNELKPDIRQEKDLLRFRRRLKTILWQRHFK